MGSEIWNPDYLIHVANAIAVAAFLARDVLLLRSLLVVGGVVVIGYYFSRSPPLWEAMGWSAIYMVIHIVWIWRILLERRPVVLNDEERALHKLTFQTIDDRKFSKILALGKWHDGRPGDSIFLQGEPVTEVAVAISGKVGAYLDGQRVGNMENGLIMGTATVISTGIAPCDALVEDNSRYISWVATTVDEMLAKDTDLRASIQDIVNVDLALKIRQLTDLQR